MFENNNGDGHPLHHHDFISFYFSLMLFLGWKQTAFMVGHFSYSSILKINLLQMSRKPLKYCTVYDWCTALFYQISDATEIPVLACTFTHILNLLCFSKKILYVSNGNITRLKLTLICFVVNDQGANLTSEK